MASNLFNLLSVVAFFAVGIGLLRLINRFEPQWVSKDGTRFSARICDDEDSHGRWTEVRVLIDGNTLNITGRGRRSKGFRGAWKILCLAEISHEKKCHYVVTRKDDSKITAILRIPANSVCVGALDALVG